MAKESPRTSTSTGATARTSKTSTTASAPAQPSAAAAPIAGTSGSPPDTSAMPRNGFGMRGHTTPVGTPAAVSDRVLHLPSDGDREARRRRVAEAAYYRAERRGFAPGGEIDDWLEAEREIAGSESGSERKA